MNNRLKTSREEAGFSQKQVAIELGVSAPTVCEWEKSKKYPSTENLMKLSSLYNVSVDYLLGKTDKKNTAPNGSVSEEDIKIALFGGADEITDEMWQEAKAFAEYIKDRERRKKEG